MNQIDEQLLLDKMSLGDRDAYTQLFLYYYKNLVLFAGGFVRDRSVCEDTVQTIFIKLWTNREKLEGIESLRSYLLKSTQNACLSYLRHMKVRSNYDDYIFSNGIDDSYHSDEYILYSELRDKLEVVLNSLSPLHRNCFIMGKIEGRKYAEIALELNVSVRTAELKVAESLKMLRSCFKHYFIFF